MSDGMSDDLSDLGPLQLTPAARMVVKQADKLEEIRLYAELLARTSTREARSIGADILQILERDDV